MFAPDELHAVVKAIIPDGKKEAIMGAVDKEGVQIVIGLSIGKNNEWEVQGQFEHQWSGDNKGKFSVLWSI